MGFCQWCPDFDFGGCRFLQFFIEAARSGRHSILGRCGVSVLHMAAWFLLLQLYRGNWQVSQRISLSGSHVLSNRDTAENSLAPRLIETLPIRCVLHVISNFYKSNFHRNSIWFEQMITSRNNHIETMFIEKNEFMFIFITMIIMFWCSYQTFKFMHLYKLSVRIFESYFTLNDYDDEYVKRVMRFIKSQIEFFIEYFDIASIEWTNRYNSNSKIAMCLLLWRFFWFNRLFELTRIFYRNEIWLFSVYIDVMLHLIDRYKNIIEWHFMFNDYNRFRVYSKAIDENLNIDDSNIFDFVNDTFRDVCRSLEKQKNVYSEYKKRHEIKWQSIIFLDELIVLNDSYENKANDWTIWNNNKMKYRIRHVRKFQIFQIRVVWFGDWSLKKHKRKHLKFEDIYNFYIQIDRCFSFFLIFRSIDSAFDVCRIVSKIVIHSFFYCIFELFDFSHFSSFESSD